MKNKIKLFGIAILLFVVNIGHTQILGWNFSDPDTKGNEESAAAKLRDPNLKPSELIRGNALINPNTFTRSFVSRLSLVGTSDNTKEKAFSKGAYYEFRVQPNKGYTVALSSLKAKLRPGAGGPYYYRWAYSLDGKKFNELGDKDVSIKYDYGKPDGLWQPVLQLSGVRALQEIGQKKGVVFRLYIWGGTNPETATFTIGRSEGGNPQDYVLSLDGEVKAK
ncbi:hypothetical protein G5B30_09465 [Sphingobacterium sp. SGG-5]|uniref:hypothetical protein n=1 Tax=Sphingobacterium sp. SGG-5 TaxID=2710881 RepID=UPI0013EC42DA|nr:hypothetical protein [Sphingobacterium sp. SGG-5]NGM62141.1 hypothetical protein [Sphingobacterium sp. SGG-5]